MVYKITANLSDLLGFLCAEGCYICQYSSYWGKDRGKDRYYKNQRSERIEFYSIDIILLNHYKKVLKKEFNYSVNITKNNKINICRRDIIRKILSLTSLGCENWIVPNIIIHASDKVKTAFLKGFFDGDGTASGRIRFFSINKSGLLQVSNLLNELSLKHTFRGPVVKKNRKPYYVIHILSSQKERFLNLLKPLSKVIGQSAGVAN